MKGGVYRMLTFLLLFVADFKIESWIERQKAAFEAG
jgi:hypothetical protein